jgi:hypothetical protein
MTAVERDDLMDDPIPRFESGDLLSHFSDYTHNFVTTDDFVGRMFDIRFISEPFVDITATNSTIFDFYEYIIRSEGIFADFRDRNFL